MERGRLDLLRAIGSLLTKMEGLVGATNTGHADKMANYYRHRERQVYDAIYQVITMNLQKFVSWLKVAEPLFYAEAMLNSQDTVLSTAPNV